MKTKFTYFMLLFSIVSVFQFASAEIAQFNVTVPNDGGSDNHHQTNSCRIVGNFNGWDVANAIMCTKVDDTHYTVTLDEATFTDKTVTLATLAYKYVNGPDWAYVVKTETGDELPDNLKYAGTSPQEDVVVYWASVWKDVVPIPMDATLDLFAPKTVTEAYVTGNFNDWKTPGFEGKTDSTSTKMTLDPAQSDANGNYFTIKIHTNNAYALAFQFTTGPAWAYQQNQGNNSYPDVSQTSALFDAVGDANVVPVVEPQLTFKRIYPGAAGLKTLTFTTTMPANTTAAYIRGELNGGLVGEFIAGTNNNDGTFTFSVPGVDIMYYKYYNDMFDANVEYNADNTAVADNRTADAQVQTAFTDVVAAWISSGVKSLDVNKYRVYTSNKSIVVEGVVSKAELFDISGRSIESKVMSGTFRTNALNAGLYIVKVDGQTQKVSVK
ncbi:MAG: hypothetical protein AUK44_01730 [Porphyromonadaceae bacterium CG2_30_38_12]|nr:MAG: hypothetical protein AUK44_01730 [Porphyromonadaceae bacterium CG2_30_38_12]